MQVRICLNAALHRIAITQIRCEGEVRIYYLKRQAAGDTTTEPCALERRIARRVFALLHPTTSQTGAMPAAA